MKYLGIDYGSKRIGLAVSDEGGSIAFPLEVAPTNTALERVKKIIDEKNIGALVVGDTRSHGGAANAVTADAEQFVGQLARETGLPVSRAFEAWSSIEASRYAPGHTQHDDSAAAAIILQRFLDMHPKT